MTDACAADDQPSEPLPPASPLPPAMALLDALGLPAACVSPAGRILRVNARLVQWLGRAADALVGARFQDFTHPDDLAADLDHAMRLLAGETEGYVIDKRYLRPDGSVVGGRLRVGLARDAAGAPLCFVSTVEPLEAPGAPGPPAALAAPTAPTALAASRLGREPERAAHLRMAIESMGGFAYEWDLATGAVERIGRVQALLGAAAAACEERMDERVTLDSAGWAERVHAEDAPGVWAGMRAALDDAACGGWHHEYRVRRADGRYGWIADTARIVRDADGRALRVVGAATDVDARRTKEQALAAARHDAEAARAELEAMLAAISDAFFMLGRDWRFTYLNAQAERLLGQPRAALIGRSIWDAFAEAVGTVFHDQYQRAMRTGEPAAFEAYYPPLAAWFEARAYPGPQGLAVYFQDVTARRVAAQALAASEARLRAVFEAAPVGIVIAEAPSGRVIDGNQRAEAIVGHPILHTPDVASYGRWVALHADGRPVRPEEYPMARVIAAGEQRAELEVLYQRGDGRRAWVRFVAAPVLDAATGAVAGGVVVALDVDAERRAIQALRDADARKDEFLAVLAHELRNPLAPIRNAVRLLARAEPLTERGQGALAVIARQSEHMTRLVDDLLEVSRITRGKIELRCEPMLLATAVSHVVEALLPSIEARRQTLDVEQPRRPVKVVADTVRLHQVLTNLLSNASKYTPEGGAIRVQVEDATEAAVVRVTDNGVGLAPEALERIFDLFTQAESTLDRAAGGLGIGLAMVRRLVELHGGSVHAESAGPGQGATFVVRLPKDGPTAPAAPR